MSGPRDRNGKPIATEVGPESVEKRSRKRSKRRQAIGQVDLPIRATQGVFASSIRMGLLFAVPSHDFPVFVCRRSAGPNDPPNSAVWIN
ncbi:hypothetical protein AG1IA_01244 [Rhizoctonia solani AG-1 IA]|uniref:Uncharacterized protein n=1 Tax=Thanatephorus cucumeris (strain AG1-IA) TaxID=983506 RepID=L8X7U3_THACA|nr:hypothetical protein AG1IA_01244 [Rhizoctonia solani AG-1 IA]